MDAIPIYRKRETLWGIHEECLAKYSSEHDCFHLANESEAEGDDDVPSFGSPQINSLHDFQTRGIWLSKGDSISYGGTPPKVYGISLSSCLISILELLESPFRVMYHGTDEINYQNICEKKLLPTLGQLGFGVYVGTFWKACRFACRTQDYTLRENPLVFRLYVRNIQAKKYPPKFDHLKIKYDR